MDATAPEGTPPRRIGGVDQFAREGCEPQNQVQEVPCPAMPRRGPEAGRHRSFSLVRLVSVYQCYGFVFVSVRKVDPRFLEGNSILSLTDIPLPSLHAAQ